MPYSVESDYPNWRRDSRRPWSFRVVLAIAGAAIVGIGVWLNWMAVLAVAVTIVGLLVLAMALDVRTYMVTIQTLYETIEMPVVCLWAARTLAQHYVDDVLWWEIRDGNGEIVDRGAGPPQF